MHMITYAHVSIHITCMCIYVYGHMGYGQHFW